MVIQVVRWENLRHPHNKELFNRIYPERCVPDATPTVCTHRLHGAVATVLRDHTKTKSEAGCVAGAERRPIKVIGRHTGKEAAYRDVKDEIETSLLKEPLTQSEWLMWQVKLDRLTKIRLEGF